MSKAPTTSITVPEAKQLDQKIVSELQASFNPLFQKAQEWKTKAEGLTITDAGQKKEMAAAREARLELKNIRVEADKIRKQLKEESLLKSKAIDGMFNIIKFLIVPVETHLEEQEKFIERQEEKRLAELEESRKEKLSRYLDNPEQVEIYNVRIMSEEAFNGLLESQKKLYEIRKEEERKVEEKRLAEEKAAREEQERVRLENEKLKKEAEERAQKEAAEKKAREEKEAKERAIQEEKLKKEREAREKAEAELKAKQEAEEKQLRDLQHKKEEEEAAAAELEKRKAAAPDKEKLKALAAELIDIHYPELVTEDGKKILAGVKDLVAKVNIYIVKNIEKL